MTITAMQQALVKAGLATKEEAETTVAIPHHLLALDQEINELATKLPEGDTPSPVVLLLIGVRASRGDQKGALEVVRDAMKRRIVELAL